MRQIRRPGEPSYLSFFHKCLLSMDKCLLSIVWIDRSKSRNGMSLSIFFRCRENQSFKE